MSTATQTLETAQAEAMRIRPEAGGFPVLAEVLRRAGVYLNEWQLPSAQSIYLTEQGPVIQQGEPLATGTLDVASFDEKALIDTLRRDQSGEGTFPEFLSGCWNAGVVRYVVDFDERLVTYFGVAGESCEESYPEVEVPQG